ncbi:hypothetical protein QQZ08_003981 [Neonectria magnoliae]|uniref:Uncharacterized protein n=1 Tax=Neonectria magnoliae TaxID=2732573 RepID=A0ABR1I855_9HYPO
MPRSAKMNPARRNEIRARDAEYQAMWQGCQRTARRDEYMKATVPTRIIMLREALTTLMEKSIQEVSWVLMRKIRRQSHKHMCNTNIEVMIERHLGREAMSRAPIDLTGPRPNRMNGRGHANNYNPPAMDNDLVYPKRETRSRSPTPNRNLLASHENEGGYSNYNYPPPPMSAAPVALPSVEAPLTAAFDHNGHHPSHPSYHSVPLAHDGIPRNGPEAYPPILENGHQYTTLYDELAACRSERCDMTHRIRGLENKLEHVSNVISVLCMQLRSSAETKPQVRNQTGLAEDEELVKWDSF